MWGVRAIYMSDTVNSKSFVNKVLLRIKWNYESTMHFKHEMIGKHFTEISQKLWIKWNLELTVFELTVHNLYHETNYSDIYPKWMNSDHFGY